MGPSGDRRAIYGSHVAGLFAAQESSRFDHLVPVKAAYARDLKSEFDMLCTESAKLRRMMSVSARDRIAGRPSRIPVPEEFIEYARGLPGVVFMRRIPVYELWQ